MKSEYADAFLSGHISMASLFDYWDIKRGKIMYDDWNAGKVTENDVKNAIEFHQMRLQDIMEGGRLQLPNSCLPWDIKHNFRGHIIHDINYRIEAYGYCNLSCFFRVDYVTQNGECKLDKENIAYLAQNIGINVTTKMLKASKKLTNKIMKKLFPTYTADSYRTNNLVQLPNATMDKFGDVVVLIKNEEEFVNRILKTVKIQGGECIIGDIRYHQMQDRLNSKTMKYHHCSLAMKGHSENEEDIGAGLFDIGSVIKNSDEVIRYGCLDKYDMFAHQREWRVCWLPNVHNHERKELHVGDISDIAEIVSVSEIRQRLMEDHLEYIPGYINGSRTNTYGTVSYLEFMNLVENIDRTCRLFIDID